MAYLDYDGLSYLWQQLKNYISDAISGKANTSDIPNVPSWALNSTKPSYTAQEVGALPSTTTIPTNLSQLNSDATHRLVTDAEKESWITSESDPIFAASPAAEIKASDISNWNSKTSNMGTITSIKMNGSTVGSSGEVNLGTVITSHQSLANYVEKESGKGLSSNDFTTAEKQKLTDLYSKSELDTMLSGIKSFSYELVSSLPTNPGENNMYIIYLVPNTSGSGTNVKDEYILTKSGNTYTWELLGTTQTIIDSIPNTGNNSIDSIINS